MRTAVTLTAVVLLAIGSGPARPAADGVRAGNAAARRGDFDAAQQEYAAAAALTTDPGLVAFNRGVVALQRGQYRDAELHFSASLDDRDAPAERVHGANYNLGLALLQRGGSSAVYRAAADACERCLAGSPADGTLRSDAAHNLELAKLLGRAARDRERLTAPPVPESAPEEATRPSPPTPSEVGPTPETQAGTTAGAAERARTPAGAAPRTTTQTTPGTGTLPVLPDAETYPPLTPADARALLQGHANRLAKSRAAAAELPAGPERSDARDW